MNVNDAYNIWAEQYDTNENKTRDLEGMALRKVLADIPFDTCLEIGCGTGKNTEWLITKASSVTAVDFSDEMLAKAKSKMLSDRVAFIQADITKVWKFADNRPYALATCSLVLEHIEHLEPIFENLSKAVRPGGYVYMGELHPFKQYNGTKARFETENGLQVVTCFNHHVSDFTHAAMQNGFELVLLDEYFDHDDRTTIPRILTLLFKKKG